MAKRGGEILDARPRKPAPRSPIMFAMQSTSPIRRYVLLRQPGSRATASRWSMQRIAPASGSGSASPAAARAKAARDRG